MLRVSDRWFDYILSTYPAALMRCVPTEYALTEMDVEFPGIVG